jgi:hypothetical protein
MMTKTSYIPWTHVFSKGKQFLLLIMHPPCYSYIFSSPIKVVSVMYLFNTNINIILINQLWCIVSIIIILRHLKPQQWCNGQSAGLVCSRLWVRYLVGSRSNQWLGVCCFFSKHIILMRKTKDWLIQNKGNMYMCSDMFISTLLFQSDRIMQIQVRVDILLTWGKRLNDLIISLKWRLGPINLV